MADPDRRRRGEEEAVFDVGGLPEERVELPEHRLTPEGIRVEGEEPPKEKEENEPPMDADKRR